MSERDRLLDRARASGDALIFDAYAKALSVLDEHSNVVAAISGGSDSDVMLDLLWRVSQVTGTEMTYVFYNTGIEYDATKRHLDYLEARYGIDIVRLRAQKPIPSCCRQFGLPFVSKYVSEHIERLQHVGFSWEDKPADVLLGEYANVRSAIRWWTNDFTSNKEVPSRYDIGRNLALKEFMLENPPDFPISAKCCEYAKKKVMRSFMAEYDFDLDCVGIRRAEGGIRAAAAKTCYTEYDKHFRIATYRPLFWLDNTSKGVYERHYDIRHSDCYTVYGFKRTGCAGCPFNRNIDDELGIIRLFEPKIYRAVTNVFETSYDYTWRYRKFREEYRCRRKR